MPKTKSGAVPTRKRVARNPKSVIALSKPRRSETMDFQEICKSLKAGTSVWTEQQVIRFIEIVLPKLIANKTDEIAIYSEESDETIAWIIPDDIRHHFKKMRVANSENALSLNTIVEVVADVMNTENLQGN